MLWDVIYYATLTWYDKSAEVYEFLRTIHKLTRNKKKKQTKSCYSLQMPLTQLS